MISSIKPEAFTLQQFCDFHGISRASLYRLIKQGRGPSLMKLGKKTLISTEAATEWRRRIEEETLKSNKKKETE